MARRGVNPYLIDRSAGYLAESMQRSVTAFDTQMANIEKSKNALTLQDAELKQLSTSLSADNENNFKDGLTKVSNDQIDNIYKLGYNSIGRDQTEYLRAKSNLLNSFGQLTEGLALMDAESKRYEEAKLSGNIIGLVSNATEKGARAFMDDIYMNNGNNITSTYENGSFILRHKDGYAVNLSNYKSVLEKGGDGIIKYINDPSKELKTIYSQHSSKYEALVNQITQNTVTKDGKKVVQTTLEKDYEFANDETREAMINDPNLLAMINQDTFQWAQANNLIKDDKDNVITGEVFGGPNKDIKVMEKQIKQTAEALVDYSMDQYGKETQVTKLIQKPFETSSTGKGEGSKNKLTQTVLDSYLETYDKVNSLKYKIEGDTLTESEQLDIVNTLNIPYKGKTKPYSFTGPEDGEKEIYYRDPKGNQIPLNINTADGLLNTILDNDPIFKNLSAEDRRILKTSADDQIELLKNQKRSEAQKAMQEKINKGIKEGLIKPGTTVETPVSQWYTSKENGLKFRDKYIKKIKNYNAKTQKELDDIMKIAKPGDRITFEGVTRIYK